MPDLTPLPPINSPWLAWLLANRVALFHRVVGYLMTAACTLEVVYKTCPEFRAIVSHEDLAWWTISASAVTAISALNRKESQ